MLNIIISRLGLKELIEKINYLIIDDSNFETIKSINDIEKLNKLVLQIIKKYIELYYKRALRDYEGRFLKTKPLDENDTNIKNIQWQLEINTSPELDSTLEQLTKLSNTDNIEEFQTNPIVQQEWIDVHIYQPLLKDDNHQSPFIEAIKPQGLNKGEFTFVGDLRKFIENTKPHHLDFFLLRNMSKGHGFGFYFLSGGFYPDFMLWIKDKNTNKQFLTFIDPHGLRNEQLQWDSPKINLYESIKSIEIALNTKNFILNSFILQPPPYDLKQIGLDRWYREDDKNKEMPLETYAEKKHVYAIPTNYVPNTNGYIDKMIRQILNCVNNV
jgi:hypothetical protein